MRRILSLLFLFLPAALSASTEYAVIDGISYRIVTKGKAAQVLENGYSGDIVIPDYVEYDGVACKVYSISPGAFMNCSNLTSVRLPSGLEEIGLKAFMGCVNLKTLTIPEGVTSIGNYAFYECKSLTRVDIPNGVTCIGDFTFYWCSSLTQVNIPESVTTIGDSAFRGCNSLTSVTIPKSVTSIGEYAFCQCYCITELTIHEGVKTISDHAFSSCKNISSLELPNSLSKIGEWAFYGCEKLMSVEFPDNLSEIGKYAFYGCKNLRTVTLPGSVKEIPDYLFFDCNSLTTVRHSAKKIGNRAFAYCAGLEEFHCHNGIPSTTGDPFVESLIEYARLYVHRGSIKEAKQSTIWGRFGEIIALGSPKCATPTISYSNGRLLFECESEGAQFHSTITDADIDAYTADDVQLTATYYISVYADSYDLAASDVATAMLCWIDKTPEMETITRADMAKTEPVLIQSGDGELSLNGLADGTEVRAYDINGRLLGTGVVNQQQTTIPCTLSQGSMAIIKIGKKSIKYIVR